MIEIYHYWFVLNTIVLHYQKKPNKIMKKKYYNLIQNYPIFLPNENIRKKFIDLLNEFPVSPYLDGRESFTRWIHFIHNRINNSLGKKTISLSSFLNNYYENYKPKSIIIKEQMIKRKKYIYLGISIFIIGIIYNMRNK